jgi:hypothetical protein
MITLTLTEDEAEALHSAATCAFLGCLCPTPTARLAPPIEKLSAALGWSDEKAAQ